MGSALCSWALGASGFVTCRLQTLYITLLGEQVRGKVIDRVDGKKKKLDLPRVIEFINVRTKTPTCLAHML